MNEQQVAELIRKYNEGTLQPAEKTALDIWYLKYASESNNQLSADKEDEMVEALKSNLPLQYKKAQLKLWPRIWAVAAVLILMVSVALWFSNRPEEEKQFVSDVKPGKSGATLTLASGKKILINDAVTGDIANESGVKIIKADNGAIIYEITETGATGYNTLTTTTGEQTQVRLPDGSTVFLNAESVLKFPVSFSKSKKRIVTLTGEGYFEVTHDKMHPFIVQSKNQTIEVLGTSFNINNYVDEAVAKTTLLEGSIRLSNLNSNSAIILKPGDQGIVKDMDLDVKAVEIEDVVAWKNGYFMFNNETLESIMKKISRWYSVTVLYEDESVKRKTFFGTISRYGSIADLLKLLQKTEGASFDINNKQIIVSKKK